MAVNLHENPFYFRMFQVLVTLCLNMKVDLSPKTTIQTWHYLLDGEIQRQKTLRHPSLLAFRLQLRLNFREISKADSAFHNSTACKDTMHVTQEPWAHRDFFSYHKFLQPSAIHMLIERRPGGSEFLTKRTEEADPRLNCKPL